WLAQLLRDLGLREILVAVGRPRPLPLPPAVAVVEDLYPGLGPLAGIHAGLRAARHPACLVVACDMPFLAPALARELLRGKKTAVKVCLRRGLIEPFPGVYPKTILSALEQSLTQGRLSVQEFIRTVPHVFVAEEVVARLDPEGQSFVNLNTREALACVPSE
ncbi:MAG: molybdenum cofactor guanylyltransferase, partial [Candidatus Bipolaricaulaceae bacterium]